MKQERNDNIRPSDEEATTGEEPQGPENPLDALQLEVDESNKGTDEFKEMLQRTQADFINYKRRAEEEREEQQKYSNTRLILKLLPVIDEFDVGIDHASNSGAEASWLEGMKLIRRKLSLLLESEKVTRIEVDGKEFSPLEHEAIAYQESADHQEGEILAVVRDGYKTHDRVIRPALIIVAKRPKTSEEESVPFRGKETEDA